MNAVVTRWSDAEKDAVKALYAEGRSAAEIARTLPGRTRNMVIGVIMRMGLSSAAAREARKVTHAQRMRATAKSPRMSKEAKGAKAGRASILAATQVATKPVSLKPVVGNPTAPSPAEVAAVIGGLAQVLTAPPSARRLVSMMALESGMCRNPVDEDRDGPLFCGASVRDRRASYCVACARVLTQPASAMRPIKSLSEPAPRRRIALGHIRYGG